MRRDEYLMFKDDIMKFGSRSPGRKYSRRQLRRLRGDKTAGVRLVYLIAFLVICVAFISALSV
ncbi:MAG: hypothetical protein KIT24_11605 [Phycisphaeraceae bacterium]|nr:hypothetical protein [Phycisphaeraceae bacterium]